jgi:hypothetical protein
MIRIKPLTLDDGTQILVEVEEAHIPAPAGTTSSDLGGATGEDTMALLRASIAGLARSVRDSLGAESLGDHAPQEWTIELSIGFKGEHQPVPVVVTGSATGSVKVTARWKHDD